MSDVLRGLQAGYSLADNYINTQENNKDRALHRETVKQQNEFRGLQQEQQKVSWEQGNQIHQQNVEQYKYEKGQRPTTEQMAKDIYQARLNSLNTTTSNQQFQLAQGKKIAKAQEKQKRQIEAGNMLDYMLSDPNGFQPDNVQRFSELAKGTQLGNLLDMETQTAIKTLSKELDSGNTKLLMAETRAPMLSHGFNPQQAQTNEVIDAAGKVLKPDLMKAVGTPSKTGNPIGELKFLGFEKGERGLRAKLLVTDTEGQTYPSYVSELRSSDPNDPIKELNPDDLMQHLSTQDYLVDILHEKGVFERLQGAFRPQGQPNKAAADLQGKIDVYATNADLPRSEVTKQMLYNQSQDSKPRPLNPQDAIKLAQKDLESEKLNMNQAQYEQAVNSRARQYLNNFNTQAEPSSGGVNTAQQEFLKALSKISSQAE